MFEININIETLRNTKGIGSKTLERIIEQHGLDNDIKSFESKYIPSGKYQVDKDINLWQGDCLELMSHIPDKSVDMILADLPYGTTACSWDSIIPFEPLWSHYKRIIKDNGAIVLFGSEPFSTKLRMSNLDWYRYDWVWEKNIGGNFANLSTQPFKEHENVSIFSKSGNFNFNPILENRTESGRKRAKSGAIRSNTTGAEVTGMAKYNKAIKRDEKRHPRSVQFFKREVGLHPTQKPVELLEYLIKTYTNEKMLVLDNTMGSGSTGVACKNTNRKFIGIELDEKYFEIAKKRI